MPKNIKEVDCVFSLADEYILCIYEMSANDVCYKLSLCISTQKLKNEKDAKRAINYIAFAISA